ncbi:acyl-CoA dehydrogenase [Aureimonas endophytica]|uniref:Acyl-CoA dehydrogenase n=1 Tax=Aureimonas endophytica TaxID=2027858 RepID=A0A917E7N5_9HYPH|nr:acyl-CoA dehydrogenase [Aureimonas endophytica]GGE12998.1 acyl-CoA dehydrogenase [Aureimonas endophytica]
MAINDLTVVQAELRAVLAGLPASDDDPAPLVAVLRRHGALARFAGPVPDAAAREDWRPLFDWLVALGGIDLSLARLFEGHVNAVQLVSRYGTEAQRARVRNCVEAGGMLGVWGADGAEPVRLAPASKGGFRLSGAKRYASGAGLLRLALVPITESDGRMLLLLLDVDAPERVGAGDWDMRGMRRSRSGTYRFDGLCAGPEALVGEPEDYRREPFFVGGIWRCAAAQLGAVEAIVRLMAGELAAAGRDAHPLQMARIGQAIIAARGARLWVEDAAGRVETATGEAVAAAVALSAYGRLVTETAAMTVIDLAERALGLGSFALGHPVEALSRDLAVYIRQANPDAVLLQHGRVLMRELGA